MANFGSQISWLLIILGIVLGGTGLINLGILMFSLAVLFQIITLPVEYNASHRAVALLDSIGILEGREVGQNQTGIKCSGTDVCCRSRSIPAAAFKTYAPVWKQTQK